MTIIIMTVIESFKLEVISPFLQSRSSSMRGLISSSLNSISFKFFPLYRVISPFSANTRNLEILVFSISDDAIQYSCYCSLFFVSFKIIGDSWGRAYLFLWLAIRASQNFFGIKFRNSTIS